MVGFITGFLIDRLFKLLGRRAVPAFFNQFVATGLIVSLKFTASIGLPIYISPNPPSLGPVWAQFTGATLAAVFYSLAATRTEPPWPCPGRWASWRGWATGPPRKLSAILCGRHRTGDRLRRYPGHRSWAPLAEQIRRIPRVSMAWGWHRRSEA